MAQEIDGTAPGPDPAALAAIEANALSQLAALRFGRQALEAYELRLLASLGHLALERAGGGSSERSAMELRSIAAEIGVQARVSDRTVERQIGDAMHLVDTWPLVLDAFADGRISRGHVRAITEAGSVLSSSDVTAEQRAAYEERMVALAETTTPARVAKAARKAADAQLAEPLVDRHRAARDDRRVTIEPADDGMAWIGAYVPAVLAHGIDHRLRAGARTKPKDDPRTIDQWRADAFCELLLTGSGAPDGATQSVGADDATEHAGLLSTVRPVVQVTIPVTTLTGHDDAPATLDGVQPIDAETARILAVVAATWERLLTDPIRGTVVEVDTYQPTAAQRRLLIARDQHCRFPGCASHARTADVDHTIAWDHGGTTSLSNLAHLCRRRHTLKHATAWTVHQPRPGHLHWRSPLGEDYVDRPPATGPTFTDASESTAAIAAADAWGPPTAATDAGSGFQQPTFQRSPSPLPLGSRALRLPDWSQPELARATNGPDDPPHGPPTVLRAPLRRMDTLAAWTRARPHRRRPTIAFVASAERTSACRHSPAPRGGSPCSWSPACARRRSATYRPCSSPRSTSRCSSQHRRSPPPASDGRRGS
ncbi:HNH endonuclease signature motif containing protein [Agrococcus sp. SGAir0287]|uniref:HNH endonuclease signature motif containing protein n=1 Tax=Agrococcus sp. SGAir0287 TaxID=2070347 RepID=UPI0010CCBAD1|nr:HNH endonuclease signature motif containing protein [Agrococcus sp. SGAir0287]QCR19490.1 hypothetical protein C1N71_08670 [Agrococcus sp. SGAir0287]